MYIVYEGEFELIKTVTIKDEANEKVSQTKQLFTKALEKQGAENLTELGILKDPSKVAFKRKMKSL